MFKYLNIPNFLSLFRIALVPVFCIVYFCDAQYSHIYAAAVYAAASLTDVLDGYIARHYNMITKLGRILDPLGDKLMCSAVVTCIVIDGFIPAWALVVLLVKECGMALGGLIMYEKSTDVISSNYVGKSATVLFFVVCVIIMLFDVPKTAATLLISAALLLTIAAMITYIVRFVAVMKTDHIE